MKTLNNLDRIVLELLVEKVRDCERNEIINSFYNLNLTMGSYQKRNFDVAKFEREYDHYYRMRMGEILR